MEVNSDKLIPLLNINKLLTKSMKLDNVLQIFVNSAKELIESADAAYLFLYDDESKVLRFAKGVGVNEEIMKCIEISPGESLSGKSFSQQKSLLFARDIEKEMLSMSEVNTTYYNQAVSYRNPKSCFCVPLIYQNECLGILNIDDFKSDESFIEEDTKVLEIIADQCAISIMNSRYVKVMEKQNIILNRSIEIHESFTKLVLENKDIEQILHSISKLINCLVFYKDNNEPEKGFSIYPILSSNEELGYIHYNRNDLSQLDFIALGHGANALALYLVKENALYEKELNLRNNLFEDIIGRISSDELKKIASQFRWDVKWDFVCFIIERKDGGLWNDSKLSEKKKFTTSVEKLCTSICAECLVLVKGLQLVIITPIFKKNVIRRMISLMKEHLKDSKTILYGIGRETTLNQIINSFNEAKDAINYARNTSYKGHIVHYKELGVERLWQKLDEDTLENFVQDYLDSLFTLDDFYQETLFTLIELNKNHKETALSLHIHINTLYKRLRKIEETMDILLENTNDWHNIKTAYQIYKRGVTVK